MELAQQQVENIPPHQAREGGAAEGGAEERKLGACSAALCLRLALPAFLGRAAALHSSGTGWGPGRGPSGELA